MKHVFTSVAVIYSILCAVCTAERKGINVACGFDVCIDLLPYVLAVVVSTFLTACNGLYVICICKWLYRYCVYTIIYIYVEAIIGNIYI